jgi:hypothetical protein
MSHPIPNVVDVEHGMNEDLHLILWQIRHHALCLCLYLDGGGQRCRLLGMGGWLHGGGALS